MSKKIITIITIVLAIGVSASPTYGEDELSDEGVCSANELTAENMLKAVDEKGKTMQILKNSMEGLTKEESYYFMALLYGIGNSKEGKLLLLVETLKLMDIVASELTAKQRTRAVKNITQSLRDSIHSAL